ncbi:MAG TPA: OadG family protein [Firmicutes bacterium]|nr:OadG family protein [Bacillota bacterium]
MEVKISAVSLTVLSMIVVFMVLWGLALIINLMKWFSVRKREEVNQTPEALMDVASAAEPTETGVAPEIVAAITAALAAYLDQGPGQLMVSAIYRLAPGENWAAAGRLENTSSSSLIRRSL